jgi:hypothetical protein
MRKIIQVIKPKDKRGLYRVYFQEDNGEQYPADMLECSFKLLMCKEAIMKQGIPKAILDEFEDLVRADNDENY